MSKHVSVDFLIIKKQVSLTETQTCPNLFFGLDIQLIYVFKAVISSGSTAKDIFHSVIIFMSAVTWNQLDGHDLIRKTQGSRIRTRSNRTRAGRADH